MSVWSRYRFKFDPERLRRASWALALLTVFIALADDFTIYIRHLSTEKEDSWVRRQFAVRHDFEQLVSLFFTDQWNEPATRAESERLERSLEAQLSFDPGARAALRALELQSSQPPPESVRKTMAGYRQVFRNMRHVLDHSFQLQLDRQMEQSIRTQNVILTSNVIVLMLLLILLAMYVLERKLKDKIEDSLAKSVDDLRASNERLEELTRLRSRQLKTAAHDMKTPLAALKGFSELARESAPGDQPITRLLQRIDALTGASLEMANALFMDPVAPSSREPTTFDVADVVRQISVALVPLLERKRQRLEITRSDKGSWIRADRADFLSCLHNLVGNAVKFSPEGSRIRLSCERGSRQVKLVLRDEGPGFQPQDFVAMFKPGCVLSARPTGGETSTGYGLYSAKNIIETYGGSLSVRTHEDGGACVEVSFPLELAAEVVS